MQPTINNSELFPNMTLVKVLKAYQAKNNTEINLIPNHIHPLLQQDNDWILSISHGQLGWLPASHIEKITLSDITLPKHTNNDKQTLIPLDHVDIIPIDKIPMDTVPVNVTPVDILIPEMMVTDVVPVDVVLDEPFLSWVDSKMHYDEIFDNEKVRPPYEKLMPLLKKIQDEDTERIDGFGARSLELFKGDNALYHIPRMLSEVEHKLLLDGVTQRARAIQAFVNDHYGNKNPSYNKERVISKHMIKSMVERSSEVRVKKNFRVDSWEFWYGPDIIRGPKGEFYVCEDNLGYCGGFGDLVCARETLLGTFPEFKDVIKLNDPKEFYKNLSDHYKSLVGENEVVVLLHYPRWMTADNEEKRVIKLFKNKNKIFPVINQTNTKKGRNMRRRLSIEYVDGKSTVYYIHEKKKGTIKLKVGLVIIDAEPFDVDPMNRSVKRKIILDEGKYWLDYYQERLQKIPENVTGKKALKRLKISQKLEHLKFLLTSNRLPLGHLVRFLKKNRREDFNDTLKQGYKGLLDCYYEGSVKIVNGPGFDFIGDKLFCTLMDKMIKFYLKEEPILNTIPTFSFATDFKSSKKKNEESSLNVDLLKKVFDNTYTQNYVVVKRVDGRGGDSVWVGPKIPREAFLEVRAMVEKEPEAFIVQKYIALSQVDNQLVDIRCLGNVSNSSIIFSETFWGRGVPLNGSNGKVNISDRGFEFAICEAK